MLPTEPCDGRTFILDCLLQVNLEKEQIVDMALYLEVAGFDDSRELEFMASQEGIILTLISFEKFCP